MPEHYVNGSIERASQRKEFYLFSLLLNRLLYMQHALSGPLIFKDEKGLYQITYQVIQV